MFSKHTQYTTPTVPNLTSFVACLYARYNHFPIVMCRYQRATRDVNRSLNRLNASLIEFSHPLKGVVQRSAPALAGRANPIGRK